MADRTKELVDSEEMKTFSRVLAMVQTNAIFRVMEGKSAADVKELAKEETDLLKKAADGKHKCPPGTIWDEVSGGCVPIGVVLD